MHKMCWKFMIFDRCGSPPPHPPHSHLLSPIFRLSLSVSCLPSFSSHLPFFVSRLPSPNSCLPSPVSHILSFASCLPSPLLYPLLSSSPFYSPLHPSPLNDSKICIFLSKPFRIHQKFVWKLIGTSMFNPPLPPGKLQSSWVILSRGRQGFPHRSCWL